MKSNMSHEGGRMTNEMHVTMLKFCDINACVGQIDKMKSLFDKVPLFESIESIAWEVVRRV